MKQSDEGIRETLQQIISEKLNGSDEPGIKQIQWQINRIEKVLKKNAIYPVKTQDFQDYVNCYAYGLSLWKLEEFINLAKNHLDSQFSLCCENIINSAFVKSILESSATQKIDSPIKDCLIVYTDEHGNIQHLGIIKRSRPYIRVISKWGVLPVFEHRILDVPITYGSRVKYYKITDFEFIKKSLN